MVSGVYETGSVGRVSMARGGELAVGLSGTTVRTSLGSPPVLCAVRVGVFVCVGGGVCVAPIALPAVPSSSAGCLVSSPALGPSAGLGRAENQWTVRLCMADPLDRGP